MRIYLDEDLASGLLAKLLQKAGHDVASPAGAGLLGRADAVQLACAIHENRACLSRNYEDFEELHLLIAEAQGRHFGILVVRRENDPTRDLTVKGIVAAIRKLESAGVPIDNEYIVLNHWR
jgi:predicted nuclease of predicted toxin-antitoxin system